VDNLFGWMGKILRINLTNGNISFINTRKYIKYIGGIGIGLRIAWEEIPPKIEPFDDKNKLIFMTGPLGGIPIVPGAGRANLCCVSPHIHPIPMVSYSNIGGDWPVELKFAGFDGLIVEGKASSPVYIIIHNEKVEIKKAKYLWGLDTYQTQEKIIEQTGDKNIRTICIGPAGENLVRFASIQSDTGSAFGQGGFGAVMGSKQLKAITVRGTGSIRIAQPEKLIELAKYASSIVFGHAVPGSFESQIGPEGKLWGMNSGIGLARSGYGIHSDACYGCSKACRGYFKVPNMRSGQGVCVQWFFGIIRDPKNDGVGMGDKATYYAKLLCDTLGIDTVEISGMLYWLRDCVKDGIISNNDIDLPKCLGGNTDNIQFLSKFIKEGIAYRKGFGDILAEGTARAAEKLGHKAWDIYQRYFMSHGMHTHWCNSVVGCLEWAMDNRDPFDSGHDYLFGMNNKSAAKFAWGSEAAADPESYDHVPKTLTIIQYNKTYKDMLTLCDFAFPCISNPFTSNGLGDMELPYKLFFATTGMNIRIDGLEKSAETVINIYRALMVGNGRNRDMDNVYPVKFDKAFFKDGMARMFELFGPLDKDKWEKMKDNFYKLRGWDIETGWPTEDKLKELGLYDVIYKLRKLKKKIYKI